MTPASRFSLDQLAVFLRVHELGSLSRAAAAMNTVQPALSRQLRALEGALGVSLFHRTGRGVTPTAAGDLLAQHARAILEAVRAAEDDVRQAGDALSGEVLLGVTPMVAQVMTGPLIAEVKRRHPDVRVQVLEGPSGAVTEWVARGQVDLAVMYKPPAQFKESQDSEILLSEALCVISASGRAPGETVAFADLGALPLALPSPINGMRRRLDALAAEHGARLAVATEIDSYATIVSMVRTAAAMTILPAFAVRDEIDAGVLAATPITDPEVLAHLSLYVCRAHPLRRPARAMIEIVQELARRLGRAV